VTRPSGPSGGGTASPEQPAGPSPDDDYADDAYPGDFDDEPVPEQDRPPRRVRRLRRRTRSRRFRRWRRAFFALILAAVVAAGAWALFFSPWLMVRSVVVTGNRLVSRTEILAKAGVATGTPLIRVNTGRVAARVGGITQVAGVSVARSWPDRLVITVRERAPAMAVTLSGGGYDLVDVHGVLVRQVATRPAGLPLFSAPADVSSPRGNPDIAAAAAVLAELPASLRGSVRSVTAPSPAQVTLHLAHGVTVLWGSTAQAAVKAEELNAVLHTHASYYDVSEPGTVTSK
jgi:cell division protein FtsQ